jgi:endo-1,4-beta-xylanase
LSRRDAITTMLAATVALGATAGAASAPTLQAAAAHGGRFFGSAVRIDELNTEKDLRDAVLRECWQLVPEYEMNWNSIEPAYGELSFGKMDGLAAFAIRNGKRLRGHMLLWHLSVPQWADEILRERPDWNLIARYFASVIPRYGDVINTWEVVNEPIDVGHRMDGLRENVFLQAFGPDYISRALQQARIFAPKGQLLVNEYGLEYDNVEERDRRYLLLKLLERLRQTKTPLDGLGLQSHLDLSKGRVSQTALVPFLREVADLGLSITVTELDVKEANYVASEADRDRMVADETRRYLDIVLNQSNVLGVTTWGLTDRHSWLEVTPQDYARFPGAWSGGSGPGFNRGLPFDSSMHPKPMYYAIRDALWNAKPLRQIRRK